MKKILFVLIACFIFVIPVMGQDIKPTPIDEMSGLSNQQLLTVYDAVVSEIQKRGVDTSAQTLRDSSIIFGQNIHIQTGQLSVCLPTTASPDTSAIQLPIAPTATPVVLAGDKASYDSQTPLDGTHVGRGQIFDITWYLMNTGTTTWTTRPMSVSSCSTSLVRFMLILAFLAIMGIREGFMLVRNDVMPFPSS